MSILFFNHPQIIYSFSWLEIFPIGFCSSQVLMRHNLGWCYAKGLSSNMTFWKLSQGVVDLGFFRFSLLVVCVTSSNHLYQHFFIHCLIYTWLLSVWCVLHMCSQFYFLLSHLADSFVVLLTTIIKSSKNKAIPLTVNFSSYASKQLKTWRNQKGTID